MNAIAIDSNTLVQQTKSTLGLVMDHSSPQEAAAEAGHHYGTLTLVPPEVEEINRLHGEVLATANRTLEDMIRIGGLLAKLKEDAGHGNWGNFVKENLHLSWRSVQNYLALYKRRDRLKCEASAYLPMCKALGLIPKSKGKQQKSLRRPVPQPEEPAPGVYDCQPEAPAPSTVPTEVIIEDRKPLAPLTAPSDPLLPTETASGPIASPLEAKVAAANVVIAEVQVLPAPEVTTCAASEDREGSNPDVDGKASTTITETLLPAAQSKTRQEPEPASIEVQEPREGVAFGFRLCNGEVLHCPWSDARLSAVSIEDELRTMDAENGRKMTSLQLPAAELAAAQRLAVGFSGEVNRLANFFPGGLSKLVVQRAAEAVTRLAVRQ